MTNDCAIFMKIGPSGQAVLEIGRRPVGKADNCTYKPRGLAPSKRRDSLATLAL